MKKIIHLILFTVTLSMHSYAQPGNRLRVNQNIVELQARNENFHSLNLFNSATERMAKGNGSYIHYMIDKYELQKVFDANYRSVKLSLPLPDGSAVHLLLTQHQILTGDFKLNVTDEKGIHEIERTPGLYYMGIIEGNKSRSMVACTIFNSELACVISDETGNWNLGPLEGKENEYAYYNDKTFQLPFKYTCSAKDGPATASMRRSAQDQINNSVDKCVKIFFDCAYDLYVAKGNNASEVSRYVTSLFNVVATLFYNESITVSIQSIHVWTVDDPFVFTDRDQAWLSFKTYYLSHPYTGDIAQLLSTQADGGTAFGASMCAPDTIGVFSFSGLIEGSFNSFPTYSWDAFVITHEDGHVLGSNHTQWCGWAGGPIDNCVAPEGDCQPGPAPTNGGTIMSYCHLASYGINFSNGFGTQPGNAIRNYVASLNCLTSCICPSVMNIIFPITITNTLQFSASAIIYGSNLVANGTNVIFRAGNNVTLTPGFYAQAGCKFIVQNGPCISSSSLKSIDNTSITLSEVNTDIKIIPNPFNSTFVLSINSKQNVEARVIIYNSIGAKIKEQTKINLLKGINAIEFNVTSYPKGVYMVEINTGNIKTVKKIVKM